MALLQVHRHLSDSVWLFLASASVDSLDAVYTKVAVAPVKVEMCLLSWMSRCCPLWLWEHRCSPVVLLMRVPEAEAQARTLEAEEAGGDPADE